MASNFSVKTNHPVALDSLDHLHPSGAALNNSENRQFNWNVTRWIKTHLEPRNRPLRCMDIGCAGGGYIKTMLDEGWDAIGIEGSSYPLLNHLFNWPELANRHLFTCDATRPFTVQIDDSNAMFAFDLITAWEVMEHIEEVDIPRFLENVYTHLAPDGLFICSITSVDCPHGYYREDGSAVNVDLHVTCRSHEWWVNKFEVNGFVNRPDISDEIGDMRIRYGTMTHIGPRREDTATNYGDDFHKGNYVFTKAGKQ
jgi:cyclopropane fatty-acyl-phospholipid synthase-like methyltransferase